MATFLDETAQNKENNESRENEEFQNQQETATEEAFQHDANTLSSSKKSASDEHSVSQKESDSTAHGFDANQHPPDLFTGTFQEEQSSNNNMQSLATSAAETSHVYLSSSDESKYLQPDDLIEEQHIKKSDEISQSDLHTNVMTSQAAGIIIDDDGVKQSLPSSEHMQIQTQSVTTSHESHIEASEAATIAANIQSMDTQNTLYQQQPTYVLLQTGGDSENGGQPQVFLAMQTGAVTSADSQAYITLHPVSVEGQDLSGFTAEGVNLQHAVLTQSGLPNDVQMGLNQSVSLGDIKGLPLSQTIDANSQMYIPTAGHLVAAGDGTDPSNAGVLTYIQPVDSLTSGQAQVLMAVAEDEAHTVRDNSQLRVKRVSSASNTNLDGQDSSDQADKSNSSVASQSRRRLSNDPRTCDECGRTFKYPSDLKKHLQIHTDMKKFQCEECCRCFRRLHQLNVHKRIHSGEKPYVCNRCGAEFRHDSTLTMHIRTRHDHLKPFACDGCGKNFGRMSHLRKHQRNVCGKATQRGNIFPCKYCEKSFTRKSDLRHHIVSCDKKPEKPEKPDLLTATTTFACEHCNKEFARNYDFKRHQLSHSDEKPFGCPHCSRNFKERASLHKHMKRMHSLLTGDNLMEGVQDENEAAQHAIATITAASSEDGMTSSSNAADIMVSLSHDINAVSESHNTIVTAHALAQAGIIENADQILQGSHTIAAADILNFPEVAAALGLNSTAANQNASQTMVVEQEPGTANIITMATEHAPITDEQLHDQLETEHHLEINDAKNLKQFDASAASLQLDTDGLIIDTTESANQDEAMITNEEPAIGIHSDNETSMTMDDNEENFDENKKREDLADKMMKTDADLVINDADVERSENVSDEKDYVNLHQSIIESEKETMNNDNKTIDGINVEMS